MGNQDLDRIHPVYRYATDYSKITFLPFHFAVDDGNYETAIVFNLETGDYRKPKSQETWHDIAYPELMICPDILDYTNKIVIEFEEETGNRKSGAHYAKKGHGHEGDYSTRRDERRNECYRRAGFKLFRLWDSQFKNNASWRIAVSEFLNACWRKNLTDSMTLYEKIPNLE